VSPLPHGPQLTAELGPAPRCHHRPGLPTRCLVGAHHLAKDLLLPWFLAELPQADVVEDPGVHQRVTTPEGTSGRSEETAELAVDEGPLGRLLARWTRWPGARPVTRGDGGNQVEVVVGRPAVEVAAEAAGDVAVTGGDGDGHGAPGAGGDAETGGREEEEGGGGGRGDADGPVLEAEGQRDGGAVHLRGEGQSVRATLGLLVAWWPLAGWPGSGLLHPSI